MPKIGEIIREVGKDEALDDSEALDDAEADFAIETQPLTAIMRKVFRVPVF